MGIGTAALLHTVPNLSVGAFDVMISIFRIIFCMLLNVPVRVILETVKGSK